MPDRAKDHGSNELVDSAYDYQQIFVVSIFLGNIREAERLHTVEAPQTEKSHAEQTSPVDQLEPSGRREGYAGQGRGDAEKIEANEHSTSTTPSGSFLTFHQSPPTRRHRQTVVGRTGRKTLGSRLNKQQK